jgi:TolA-binding protein
VAVSRGNSRDLVRAGERWPAAKVPAAVASVAKLDAGPDNAPTVRHPAPAHVEPRELFEQAAAKEHSAPSEALRLYRRAARVGGPWAANALFAQARLLLAQGDLRKAKSILLRYVKRFPAGPNVTDARELLKGLE